AKGGTAFNRFENLIIEHGTENGMYVFNGQNPGYTIDNCEFRYHGGSGFSYAGYASQYYDAKLTFTNNDVHDNSGDGVGITGAWSPRVAYIKEGSGVFFSNNTLHHNYGDGLGMFYWHGQPRYCSDGTTGCDSDTECAGIGGGVCQARQGSRDEFSYNVAYANGGMGGGGLGGGSGFNFDGSNENTDCVCEGDAQVREGGAACDEMGSHANTPEERCDAKGTSVDCGALSCVLDGSSHNIGSGISYLNIHHNTAYGNAGAGILYEFYAEQSLIHHNLIYDNQHSGYSGAISTSHTAFDNLFYYNVIGSTNTGNGMGAVYMGDEIYNTGNWFVHNTIDMDEGGGDVIVLYSPKDTVLKNNVYVRNSGGWVTWQTRYAHEDLTGGEEIDYNIWSTGNNRISWGTSDGICSDGTPGCFRDEDCPGTEVCFWWKGGYHTQIYTFDEVQSQLGFEEHSAILEKNTDYGFQDEPNYDYTPVSMTDTNDWVGENVRAGALAKFGVDIYAEGDFFGRPVADVPTRGAFEYQEALPTPTGHSTYYVDATNGNDDNDGLSPASAWQTTGRVPTGTGELQPGDSVLFKRGDTFRSKTMYTTWSRAPLSIRASGTEENPITFGAYGTGEKPIISAAYSTALEGWTWEPSSSGTNEYYLDTGEQMIAERSLTGYYEWILYANDNSFHRGTCVSDSTSHCGNKLRSCDIEGCENAPPGSLILDEQFTYGDGDGLGYNTIYIRSDNGDPDTRWGVFEIPQQSSTFFVLGASHLRFEDLVFEYSASNGFYVISGDVPTREDITINRCEFRYSGGGGLIYSGPGIKYYDAKITITNSEAHHNAADGIGVKGVPYKENTGLFFSNNSMHHNLGDGLVMFWWDGMPRYCSDGTTGCDEDVECVGIGDGICHERQGSRDEISYSVAYENGGMGNDGSGGGSGFNLDGSATYSGDVLVDASGVSYMDVHHNYAYKNDHAGFLFEFHCTGNDIHHNIAKDNTKNGAYTGGLSISHGCFENVIRYNVVADHGNGPLMCNLYGGITSTYSDGNIFVHNTLDNGLDGTPNTGINAVSGRDTIIKNNVIISRLTVGGSNIEISNSPKTPGTEDFDANVWYNRNRARLKACSVTETQLCAEDVDCPGGETCVDKFWNLATYQANTPFGDTTILINENPPLGLVDMENLDYTPTEASAFYDVP
ncbi:right-handed parallel beta-helix repeat-containing protein, partial [Candidatus Woesearchaeota archaeon]|nr:right-handed parallel beta-helix repeat-containing protein [Candidatus Woesearchaeota archaeon]